MCLHYIDIEVKGISTYNIETPINYFLLKT